MQDQKYLSFYFFSLQSLLKNYLHFMHTLTHYIQLNPAASNKLKQLAIIWNHPKGISNLIKNIALKSNLQPPTPHNLRQLRQPRFTPAKIECIAPQPFKEVKNPYLQANQANYASVKKEEDDELCYSPKRYRSSKREIDQSYSQSSSNNHSLKRGPYKSYSISQKKKAVQLLKHQQLPITEISRMLNIPCKNIKRWATEGISRKRGGGRKRFDPLLETQVRNWILNQFIQGEIVEIERIQEFALVVSEDKNFKASRGWVLKFIERYNLRDKYIFK